MKRRGLVVSIQPSLVVPQQLVGRRLDAGGSASPLRSGSGVIERPRQVLSILKYKVQNCIGLDVLLCISR